MLGGLFEKSTEAFVLLCVCAAPILLYLYREEKKKNEMSVEEIRRAYCDLYNRRNEYATKLEQQVTVETRARFAAEDLHRQAQGAYHRQMRLIACIEKYFEFDSDEQLNLRVDVMKERLLNRQQAENKLFKQLSVKNKAIQVGTEPEHVHGPDAKLAKEPMKLKLGHIPEWDPNS
jgi:hypothetical protein